jgi:hypothetical protein
VKRLIKFSSVILANVVLFCAASAFADSNLDPKIIIGDPTDCSGPGNCNITEDSFTFGINGDTLVPLNFQNDSTHSWTQLLLTWAPPPAFSAVTVEFGTGFGGWDFITLDGAVLHNKYGIDPSFDGVLLFCSGECSAIINGENFTMAFQPGDDGGVWPDPTDFNGQGNPTKPVPEPGQAALLLTTIAVLGTRRKSWKSLLSSFSLNTR